MTINSKQAAWAFSAGMLAVSQAWGGGLFMYEVGTNDMGTASAGWAARAQDASTVFTNPAGMTRLQKDELLIGAQVLYGDLEFSHNSNTTVSGNDGGNAIEWFPGGSAFYVRGINPDLKFGIGMYGNFGLPLDYKNDWLGRYYIQDTVLLGMSLAPSLAYRINEQWSVGVSAVAMYGIYSFKTAVNNADPRIGDGHMKIEDEDWGFGGNIGILYSPTKGTRYGLTYTSEIDLDFSDSPKFKNLGPLNSALLGGIRNLDMSMNVPQTVTASFYHELNDRWALLGSANWQNWSKFGELGVQVTAANTLSTNVNADYNDTWQLALGAQHKLSDKWLVSFGVAYDSSMMDDEERSPVVPIGEAWRLGLGAQYHWRDNLDLGLAYTLAWGGDMSLDVDRGPLAGRVAGDYNDVSIQYLAANLNWKF